MATASSGSSHLGVTENQKRWLVAGIVLNKILIPQIRPFVGQGINTEYNNLKTSHNIHGQSTSGRLQRWPARKVLKYENINGNDVHPRLPGGRFNYSLFDCRVMSHVDFARLYVENYMAHFTAFDDHCDASAVLTLLGGIPVFSAPVQTAAADVRMGRNDWAHCVFSKWDQVKYQQSFIDMEHLVKVMALPAADEGKLLGELKDWETKGTHLCMNSPIDPALLQLVQQELKSLQNAMKNMSVEFEEEKRKVHYELQNVATTLEEMTQRVQRLETGQQTLEHRTGLVEGRMHDFEGDFNQKVERLENSQQSMESRTTLVEDKVHHLQERLENSQQSMESRTMLVEDKVHYLQEQVVDLSVSNEFNLTMSCQDTLMPAAYPEKLVELIKRDYKGAVVCPFPWCEDELQLELSYIFTRLIMTSKKKERAKITGEQVKMTDVFKPHEECEKPRVVLIEGQPGMGKTTFCQKLAYDWSVAGIPPEASFPEVEILLLLKCRDMKIANIEGAINDQLLPHDAGKKEKENFFEFIRRNQSKILLVLDGLDEVRHDVLQGFLPLIKGKVFSNSYLMLTARHEAGMEVRRYCDTLLDIVGYTDEDADSYITKYFSNHEDPSLGDTLIEKLKHDSQLRELTANPLNTALLCLVCEDTKGTFPSNKTKLYCDLVSCALRRDFAKKNKSVPLDPIETCADQLNQLGKMALEALKDDRMHFNEDEMKCHSINFLQSCFLSREASVSKIRPMPCYAFTHKTFQEFFAAFHLEQELCACDKARREALLAQLSPVDKYWQVWEFLFTMVVSKSHDDAINVLSRLCACLYHKKPEKFIETEAKANLDVKICKDTSYDWVVDVNRLSEEEKLVRSLLTKALNLIAECESGENELKDYQKKMVLTLARCSPVRKFEVSRNLRDSLVISEYLKANCALAHLKLQCDLDELALARIKSVLQSDHKLLYLYLAGNYMYNLLGLFYDNPIRVSLHLWDIIGIQVHGIRTLAEVLHSNRTLTHLNLRGEWILDLGAKALGHVLEFNRTLTHLNLQSSLIFDGGAKALGEALLSNCTLTHLSLPENWIADLGAEAFAKSLKLNCGLLYLDLNQNWISNRGVMALAQALEQGPGLESNVTLTYLDLHQPFCCGDDRTWPFDDDYHHVPLELIGESGASALARALRTNCTLTYLDLGDNAIGDSGAAAIGNALKSNRNLTHLYLNNNKIGDRGAEALAKALQSERTFTQLNPLQQSYIDDSGVAELHFALVKALHGTCSTQVTRLDLNFNKIGCSGAIALADALLSNCTLERLDLGFNQIPCSGAEALAKALQSNRTLTHLNLRHNNIDDSGVTEFAETLNQNYTLTYLDLSLNPIGELGAQNLARVDQSICTLKYSEGYSRK